MKFKKIKKLLILSGVAVALATTTPASIEASTGFNGSFSISNIHWNEEASEKETAPSQTEVTEAVETEQEAAPAQESTEKAATTETTVTTEEKAAAPQSEETKAANTEASTVEPQAENTSDPAVAESEEAVEGIVPAAVAVPVEEAEKEDGIDSYKYEPTIGQKHNFLLLNLILGLLAILIIFIGSRYVTVTNDEEGYLVNKIHLTCRKAGEEVKTSDELLYITRYFRLLFTKNNNLKYKAIGNSLWQEIKKENCTKKEQKLLGKIFFGEI